MLLLRNKSRIAVFFTMLLVAWTSSALGEPTDRDAVEAQLREAMDALPDVSAMVTTTDDVEAFTLLYDDIENDQQVWNMISALVLLAAGLYLAALYFLIRVRGQYPSYG